MNQIDKLLSKTGDVALRRRARYILENLDLKNGLNIVDLGCGDGFYLYLISNLGLNLNLTGVDPDKNALQSAKKHLSKSINLKVGEIEKLPFKTSSVDRIVVSEVLEHLENPTLAVKEVYRVLKPGGIACFSVPHKNYPFFWDPVNWLLERTFKIHIKTGFWAGFWFNHLRLYSEENLKKDLKDGGFKKIKIKKLTHYCLPFNHYLINIVARILAKKKNSSIEKTFSKYQSKNEEGNNLFSLVFLLDKSNDTWDNDGSAVSLVAIVKK